MEARLLCALLALALLVGQVAGFSQFPGAASEESGDLRASRMSYSTGCVDKSENCARWATRGECDADPAYMLINCARSCDACDWYTKSGMATTCFVSNGRTYPRWDWYTNNGACDDGGPGSSSRACPLGSDSPDCPPRWASGAQARHYKGGETGCAFKRPSGATGCPQLSSGCIQPAPVFGQCAIYEKDVESGCGGDPM